MFPTTIEERIYSDETTVAEVRASESGAGTTHWKPTTLPGSGKAMLDSTVDDNNCEVISYYFAGHGEGNYISNIRFFVADTNAVADDMTFYMYTDTDFTSPGSFADVDIYDSTVFSEVPASDPVTPNVGYLTDYTSDDDPTQTEFIYFGVCVETGKLTGTASWKNRLVFQYS